MLQFINKSLITTFTTDATLYGLIKLRAYSKYVDLQEESLEFPLITFASIGGIPDNDGYPVDEYVIDMRYISNASLQEAWTMYKRVYYLINRKTFKGVGNTKFFEVREDSKPMDATEIIGGDTFFIYSGIWRFKCTGGSTWNENTPGYV